MRIGLLVTVALAAFVAPAGAQEVPEPPRPPRLERGTRVDVPRIFNYMAARPGVAIGITTSSAATSRDTLGVLVSSVLPGSPAEKAGIQEGDRIAAVNGVSLRLAATDVGDEEMSGVMSRRLSRELDHMKPGDILELNVVSNGQTKSLRVKAADSDSLYRAVARRRLEDRPTLGIGIASTGSARDSLGVFVMSVEPGGPAEKAGVEEGNRIASINGVDIRADRHDEETASFGNSMLRRLQREIEKLHPGDEATLRVYSGGRVRDVKVKVARAGDLPRRRGSMTVLRGDGPFTALDNFSVGPELGEEIQRTMTDAGRATARAFDGMRFDFPSGFGTVFGRSRVVW